MIFHLKAITRNSKTTHRVSVETRLSNFELAKPLKKMVLPIGMYSLRANALAAWQFSGRTLRYRLAAPENCEPSAPVQSR
jgi:hypothetical protein